MTMVVSQTFTAGTSAAVSGMDSARNTVKSAMSADRRNWLRIIKMYLQIDLGLYSWQAEAPAPQNRKPSWTKVLHSQISPAADPLVGLLEHTKSRTRGSGADEGVRPTFGCGYAALWDRRFRLSTRRTGRYFPTNAYCTLAFCLTGADLPECTASSRLWAAITPCRNSSDARSVTSINPKL